MNNEIETSSSIYITVDGRSLDEAEGSGLIEAVVDQHAHLPSMFLIRLFDPEMHLLDSSKLKSGQTIEIKSKNSKGDLITLITGEVTSVEPVFEQDGISLVVRGYDSAFRLYHTVRSRTFMNVKDSDLAEKVAKDWKLKAAVDPTLLVHQHIFQHNQNDLAFLMQRAWRIGYECFVKGDTLYFRKPRPADQARLKLKWGFDLLSFRPRMSNAEQVNEVIVRSWDGAEHKPIIGRAKTGKLFANTKKTPSSHVEEVEFGEGKMILVDYPVTTQSEADILAQARMDELSGTFVSAEGTAFRRPEITAGNAIELEGLGAQFSGKFLITSARHTFTASDGFETIFLINGTRTGLLIDEMLSFDNLERFYGLVTAVVTNNKDPKKMGRVKLKYPWLDTRIESDWVAVNAAAAGQDAGFFSPPSVDDQVLVIFAHGDFNRPVVIGSVPKKAYSYDDEVSEMGKTTLSRWSTRSGHKIEFRDTSDKKGLTIETKNGHSIQLDDKENRLIIKSNGGNQIIIDDKNSKISITSAGDLALKADGDFNLQATGDLNLAADGNVKVRGTRIDLN